MKKRIFVLYILTALLLIPASAMEIQLQGHFDSYTGDKFGVSFSFSEQLTNNLFIDADLEYKNRGAYLAYCAGRFSIKQISVKAGIAYDIMEGLISPGYIASVDLHPIKAFSITADLLSTFSPINLYDPCIFDLDTGLTFHLKNSNTKVLFGYRKETIDESITEYYSGIFDITAYESGLPFKIGINSTASFIVPDGEADNFDITLDVGGRLELYTARWGVYFVTGSARLLTYSDPAAALTWDASAGAKFFIY